jgi:hypothetical protein
MTSARPVAGIQGPYGEPVQAYAARPSQSGTVQAVAARPTQNGVIQANATVPAGKADSNVVQANYIKGGGGAKPGVPESLPGTVAAVGSLPGIPTAAGGPLATARTSVRFTSPAGMQIAWFAPQADGRNGFTPTQVEVPGRYNFVQGGIYRLKLSNLPGRPQVELYPTLEIVPATPRTVTFLAHSTVPIAFTEEDFEQVAAGNLVIKVIYLPDPAFQDLAVAGPDEVVSTRLEPGIDPILEATRRGSILAVVRIGNIDLEAPNTPSLNAPPGAPFQGMPLMAPPGAVPPGMMPPGGPISGPMPPPPGQLPEPNAMKAPTNGISLYGRGMQGPMK